MNSKFKPFTILGFVTGFAFLYCIGSRFGLLIEYYRGMGHSFFEASAEMFNNYLRSFSPSFLGIQMPFRGLGLYTGLGLALIAGMGSMYAMSNRKNYRTGEEHGSARYSKSSEADKLRDEKNPDMDMLMSQNVHITMNTRQTFLNNNVLVIGGSGSGKTRFFVKPNVLQMACNYIITDPKGSLLPEVATALERNGYDIKVLNLVDMSKSMRYNPFDYIYKPNDVIKFINNLIENTDKDVNASGGDPFWKKSEIAFLSALAFFVMACGAEDEKNINTIMELIDLADASEEDENAESALDIMFNELAETNKTLREAGLLDKNDYGFLAERQYNIYKKAGGKTAKSILISVGVRMAIFNIPEVANILAFDELDLRSLGEPKKDANGNLIKTALFCIISDSDSTFSFIASILYQQLYDMLYMIADARPGGMLPIHVRFIQDEFVNVGKQKDFEIKIATMRSRNISAVPILQNLAQLKNIYKDSWETIFGNCDTTIFLGGKEPSTTEYMSKLIGNTTVDYMSISESRGQSASWSKSNQLINRALLSSDEISRLGTDECLVHVRGYHIFRDKKYDLLSHPRINDTTDAPDKKLAEENRYHIERVLERLKKKDTKTAPAFEECPDEAGSFDATDAVYISSADITA